MNEDTFGLQVDNPIFGDSVLSAEWGFPVEVPVE